MISLNPYLTFAGNCREAMEFYRKILKGKITAMQSYGEMPKDFPTESSERIFNSVLIADELITMAFDIIKSVERTKEHRFSLFLTITDALEQKRLFVELPKGGKIFMPARNGLGMLRDHFGVQLMLACR